MCCGHNHGIFNCEKMPCSTCAGQQRAGQGRADRIRQVTCEGVVPAADIIASCSASSYTMRCSLNWMSHSLMPPLGRMPTCIMHPNR